jgi:hypothetical protein
MAIIREVESFKKEKKDKQHLPSTHYIYLTVVVAVRSTAYR